MFGIDEITSEISQNGVAWEARYSVEVYPPTGITSFSQLGEASTFTQPNLFPVGLLGQETLSMNMRAVNVSWPGRQIATADQQYYGPPRKIAYGQIGTDVSVTFLLSKSMAERDVLMTWQDAAVGNSRRLVGSAAVSGVFDVSYYDDYVGGLDIVKHDEAGKVRARVSLREAYPITVGDVNLSWASDDIALVTATFTYRYYVEVAGTIGSLLQATRGLADEVTESLVRTVPPP